MSAGLFGLATGGDRETEAAFQPPAVYPTPEGPTRIVNSPFLKNSDRKSDGPKNADSDTDQGSGKLFETKRSNAGRGKS